jgi:hypothetical protein
MIDKYLGEEFLGIGASASVCNAETTFVRWQIRATSRPARCRRSRHSQAAKFSSGEKGDKVQSRRRGHGLLLAAVNRRAV